MYKKLLVAVLLLITVLSATACGKNTTATTMHLKRTEGTVTVSDDKEKDVPLLEDLGLYSGYGVDTLSESYAWINLDDVKLTKMDQESEIAIQKEGKGLEIEVRSGSLFFNVTEPLEDDETMDIRTSTILVGIRGTCGWVEDRDGLSRVYILEGTVECSAGNQTVQVNAGEMAELMADGSLVVRPFTVQDIPYFVLVDLIQDPGLCSDIYNASGLDVQSAEGTEESQQENEAQEEPEEHELRELLVLDDVYESYGNAYGGSIPVKKDGLWGAINYDNEVIVPFEYDGFYTAGDKLGNFILYKSTFTEETFDLSQFGMEPNTVVNETREYYLFDNQGNIIYQGEDDVRASGGMYITLAETDDHEAFNLEYHSLDGTVLVSELCEYVNARINGFYDGISNFYNSYDTNVSALTDGTGELGPYEDDVVPQIATVDLQGNLSWREDPYYYIWWDKINESITRLRESKAARGESSTVFEGTSGASEFIGRAPLSTMNHGYYITGSDYLESGYISIYTEADDNIANIEYWMLSADGNGAVANSSGTFNEDNAYRGYFVDGVTFYNYGPNMVFVVDGKNILVDFSKNSNPGNETEDLNMDEIVTAVYDYIAMADEEYWLVQSGDRWGYIDHDGNEAALFDEAGSFTNGHAIVLEEGEAWLIDTDFNKLESFGRADSVNGMGELFMVIVGDERHIYQY